MSEPTKAELKADLAAAKAEIADLNVQLDAAQDELDGWEVEEGYDYEGQIQEIRRAIARGDYSLAIDLCDRNLPVGMRYAT